MKRIFITGINGFAGSHLLDYLLENEDCEIFGFVKPNARMRNIHHVLDKITLLHGDLIDETSIRHALQVARPDQIYHLGALSWVTPSWDMPAAYMQTNAIGTINLLEAMRSLDCKARVFISATPEEFGDVSPDMIPITEETRVDPINPYAVSKAAQDMICVTYIKSFGMNIVRTRAFNHEGPRRDIHGALASFAYQIACIERGTQAPVIKVGNLDATRNFTDVRDTVRAYSEVMEKGKTGELYLIGTQQIYTIRECLEKLISMSSEKDKITYETEASRVRPTELYTFIGNFDKLHALCGFEPQYNLEETLRTVLDYWRHFIDSNMY